ASPGGFTVGKRIRSAVMATRSSRRSSMALKRRSNMDQVEQGLRPICKPAPGAKNMMPYSVTFAAAVGRFCSSFSFMIGPQPGSDGIEFIHYYRELEIR